MKKLLYILFFSFALRLSGADFVPGYAIINNTQEAAGSFIAGASQTTVSGEMVYGGLATASDPAWAGKVVLLDRGTNTFVQKLQNVKAGGGIGAVIANNVSGGYTASLGTASSTVSAISISKEDGAKLKLKLNSVTTVSATVPTANTTTTTTTTTNSTTTGAPSVPFVIPSVQIGVPKEATVTFVATADGTTPMSWQWKLEGVSLAGKTDSTLKLYGTILVTGNYSATASNVAGSATSPNYFLQVLP